MSSSTLQFIVAGALIAAWVWMLGRPILTNLFRRSRRDSVGHFRYQQAVLGRPLDGEPFVRRSVFDTVLQPLRDWRDQSVERRRLQVMLGFAFATFASLLLAIALRGPAVRLFLVMTVSFVVYLAYAASVGAAQLKKHDFVDRSRSRSGVAGAEGRSVRTAAPQVTLVPDADYDVAAYVDDHSPEDIDVDSEGESADEYDQSLAVAEDDSLTAHGLAEADPFDGSDGFGTGAFEDEFFEPIPELQFAPLNLDASLIKPETVDAPDDGVFGEDTQIVAEDIEAGDLGEQDLAAEDTDEPEADGRVAFTTPPQSRQRPARKKARPIYIESQLDEADDSRRVVND